MKKITLLIPLILAIAIGVWCLDVYSDRTKKIITKTSVTVYDNWECGHSCDTDSVQMFSFTPNQTLDVLRIRYEKDFMAIKVKQASKSGWIIYDSRQVDLVDTNT